MPRHQTSLHRTPAADGPAWGAFAHSVLLGALVLVPGVFWRGGMEAFESSKVGVLQLAALTLVALVSWRGRGRELVREPVSLAVLAVGLAAGFCTLTSVSPATSWYGAHDSHAGLGLVLALTVVFFATRLLCRGPGGVQALVIGVAAGLPVVLVYALVQAGGAEPMAWRDVSCYAGWVRPMSTLGHSNHLAGYLVMAAPLVVWLASEAWRKGHRTAALWLALVLLASAAVVVASLSRGAWLAGVVGGCVLLAGWRCWKSLTAIAATAALVAAVLLGGDESRLPKPIAQRLKNVGNLATRESVWEGAWRLFLDRPVVGWGVDTLPLVFGRHRPVGLWEQDYGLTPARAHNDLLHALATQGAVGGAAYLGLLAALGWAGWRAWRNAGPAGRGGLVTAIGASLAAFYVQNQVSFHVVPTATLYTALSAVLSRWHEADEARAGYRTAGDGWPGILVGCVGGWLVLVANVLYPDSRTDERGVVLLGLSGLACVGSLMILRTLRKPRDTVLRPAGLSFSLGRVALILGVVAVAWTQVIVPWRASWACRDGESWQESSPPDAVACHQRAVELAPWHDLWWSRLAAAAQRAGDAEVNPQRQRHWQERERQALEMAWALEPARAENAANLARCLEVRARQGLARRDAVLPLFDRALALDPRNTTFLTDAARAAVALGYSKEALAYLKRGLRLDPNLGMLHGERGAVYLAEGKSAEAAETLHRALYGRWPVPEKAERVRALLCLAHLQRGRPDSALVVAEEVLARYGAQVSTRVLRAIALERLGRSGEAREEYQRVLRARPDHTVARAGLARLGARRQESGVRSQKTTGPLTPDP